MHMRPLSTNALLKMKRDGEKIASLTAYDASFARLIDQAGMDVILVGDSLGMVIQGHATTVNVTVNDMIYHSKIVSRVVQRACVIVDLPFHSYETEAQGLGNAARLVREGNAGMVKLEGAGKIIRVIQSICDSGIAVCGHLGLTPQSIHQLGGYHTQGTQEQEAEKMIEDAKAIEQAGASALVLECVPSSLAAVISKALTIPIIGIGAGADCDGQVLVLQDMLGFSGMNLKFSKNFLPGHDSVDDAIRSYIKAVKEQSFPALEHCMDADL